MGVVVVHHIFGFAPPDCKYTVDHLALRGFEAIMPDFFSGEAEPPGWPEAAPLEGEAFQKWMESITSDSFWESFNRKVQSSLAFLEKKGCLRFGVLGFRWGGQAAEMAARDALLTASVSVDGWGHSAASYKQVKGTMLYITAVAKVRMQTEDGKSQVSEARPHGEEDECADDNYDTLSMTSICSPHLQFVRRDASCGFEELFDDFRSTTGSEDDIADMLLLGSEDERELPPSPNLSSPERACALLHFGRELAPA
ncbi:unnamed protein product [Effrenium voratum]|nr:unnamed protein product [Effrenium voratum]